MDKLFAIAFYKGYNCCQTCGIDMGFHNPRQLCDKTSCGNELFIDDEWINELIEYYTKSNYER